MGAGIVTALLFALSAPCAAAPADGPAAKGAPPDSARHVRSPFGVMLRSTVVPGWGQVTNHKWIKAIAVVGGEGLLIYKGLDEYSKEQDATDLANSIDPDVDPDAYAAALASVDRHYNLKVNYIWWTIAVHLLQMADAYVDAHLAGFDADFGPEDDSHHSDVGPTLDQKGEPRLAVALHVRF